jgi:hypothetical protein
VARGVVVGLCAVLGVCVATAEMITQRESILEDLLERRRMMAEARALKARLAEIAQLRKVYAAKIIAERHAARLRQVNFLASKLERDHR